MALNWEEFIKESEATAPEEAAVTAVSACFRDKVGCSSPGSLEGYSEATLTAKGLDGLEAAHRAP